MYVELGGDGSKVDHLVAAPTGGWSSTPSMVAAWPFVTELRPEDGRLPIDDPGTGYRLPF